MFLRSCLYLNKNIITVIDTHFFRNVWDFGCISYHTANGSQQFISHFIVVISHFRFGLLSSLFSSSHLIICGKPYKINNFHLQNSTAYDTVNALIYTQYTTIEYELYEIPELCVTMECVLPFHIIYSNKINNLITLLVQTANIYKYTS